MEKAPEEQHPVKAFGWAARDSSGLLSPFKFSRRATGDKDVRFKVLYCGICHSDLHKIKNEWGSSKYPLVPGHEIVGEVTEVGNEVKKVKVGDKVGVGCVVGACHSCENCNNDLEIYCPQTILTYDHIYHDGTITYGGYSDTMVANERYIIRFPENLPLDASAPLLCAGITLYSPLKYYGLAEPGKHIGIVGLGGLGHVGVKFAKAFGAKVTVISTSGNRRQGCKVQSSLLWDMPLRPSQDQKRVGHEIVGEVTEVGNEVKKVKVGDKVGVGCVVGACHSCENCNNDLEIYCPQTILTYDHIYHDGTITYGGYSDTMVANERYIIRFPENLPLDASAPLLCAGITLYSPLKYYGLAEPGKHIGIVGLGGLGHVGVKFAKAFGAK
ncbi:hypothetical protein F2P56_019094, partial [Juglans regia]